MHQVHIAWWQYLEHNLMALGDVLLLGVLTRGVGAIAAVALDGVLAGIAAGVVVHRYGVEVLLAGTVVHGIFEIPATMLAGALGFEVGLWLWTRRGRADGVVSPGGEARFAFCWMMVIGALLVLAAFAEALLTPLLLSAAEKHVLERTAALKIVKATSVSTYVTRDCVVSAGR